MKKIFVFIFLFSVMNKLQAQYKIFETKTNKEISIAEMTDMLSNADYILWGEDHNDSIGHTLQHELLQRLFEQRNGEVIVSFEMWETDVQLIMNEYLNDWIREKNFIKESRAWNNYSDYKPMIEFAKQNEIPVICANAPARYVNMVTRGEMKALEKLPPQTISDYLPPLPIKVLGGRYKEKFNEIMGGHEMPNVHLYQAQNIWDATMANSIVKATKEFPTSLVLHFNGRFHSDEYEGVTKRLWLLTHGMEDIQTISCFPADEYDAATMSHLADFVIITDEDFSIK